MLSDFQTYALMTVCELIVICWSLGWTVDRAYRSMTKARLEEIFWFFLLVLQIMTIVMAFLTCVFVTYDLGPSIHQNAQPFPR